MPDQALKLNKQQAIHILGQYADRVSVPSASALSFTLSRLMGRKWK